MRVAAYFVGSLVLLAPLSAEAQEAWTPEQREVWEFELRCLEMPVAQRVIQCFHEDYTGWYAGDPLPSDFGVLKATSPYLPDGTFVSVRPLSIKAFGNVAIVHYMVLMSNPGEDGAALTWLRWTDVALKEGGRWTWIADVGGEVALYGTPN